MSHLIKKLLAVIWVKVGLVILAGILLLPAACATGNNEGFSIYLTRDDIPPARMEARSHVDIAEQPVISLEDIIRYHAATHEIELTGEAFARIAALEVPVRGRSFLVCMDRQPLYWGAFWTPVSSMSFDGVTIWLPLGTGSSNVIKLELGYPSSSFYAGTDPRNNAEAMRSLQQAGKLITGTAEQKLPRSMKGYELYSWSQDGQWHFTLITGTNRNKTLQEIISISNVVSVDGWVNIHVVGVEAIKPVLSRLPQDEHVFWYHTFYAEGIPDYIEFSFPDAVDVEQVCEHAGHCGLNLTLEPY